MSKPPRVRYESSTNPGRILDEPQEKKQRASRPGQRGPNNICGRHRNLVADDEEVEAGGSAGSAASSYTSWAERKARQATAWDDRYREDVDVFVASQPGQAVHQTTWRQTVLKERQVQMDDALPLLCPCASAFGTSCQFVRTGQQAVAYFGLAGVVGMLEQPIFSCRAHNRTALTAHPLQYSCIPTAPVNSTKLLDVELVAEYRILQLKDGVSGHGKQVGGEGHDTGLGACSPPLTLQAAGSGCVDAIVHADYLRCFVCAICRVPLIGTGVCRLCGSSAHAGRAVAARLWRWAEVG